MRVHLRVYAFKSAQADALAMSLESESSVDTVSLCVLSRKAVKSNYFIKKKSLIIVIIIESHNA